MPTTFAQPRTIRLSGVSRSRAPAPQYRKAITRATVADQDELAALLERMAQAIDAFVRLAPKPRIDFEDITCTSGTDVRLTHNFGCRVRWWVVDWVGSAAPNLRKDTTNTTADILVLDCGQTGTATIRVEAI